MTENTVNQEHLENAITTLGRTYNNPCTKDVEKAIDFLRKSLTNKKETTLVRADQVIDESGIFLPFGVPWIDTWLRGGLRLQELMLIGAIPHAGKTHTLVWCGIQFLLEGRKVLNVVGEDLLSDVKSYYQKGITDPEALKNLWFADVQDVTFTVDQIEAAIQKLMAEGNKPEVVIIDHVDLMKGTSGKADWEQVTDVMVALKMLAKRLNVIIITASQLNYDKELKGNARFYRAKVGKAANADVIIMIDDVIAETNEYVISLTKARGRKRIKSEERTKSLQVDWDEMDIQELER